jgi:hypothetical protein
VERTELGKLGGAHDRDGTGLRRRVDRHFERRCGFAAGARQHLQLGDAEALEHLEVHRDLLRSALEHRCAIRIRAASGRGAGQAHVHRACRDDVAMT